MSLPMCISSGELTQDTRLLEKGQPMRKLASIGSILLGIVLVLGGVATWIVVSSTLADQRITTPEDACLPNRQVTGPFTAYCQAKVIEKHTLEATGGKTYAELDREDPVREVAASSSFLQ